VFIELALIDTESRNTLYYFLHTKG